MEVADQIAVMNHGRDRAGRRARATLYERAGERVRDDASSGRRNRVGDDLGAPARPRAPARARRTARREAMIERVVHLGFEVRVELVARRRREDLRRRLTRDQCEELELAAGRSSTSARRATRRRVVRLASDRARLRSTRSASDGLLEHAAHARAQLDPDVPERRRGAGVRRRPPAARRARVAIGPSTARITSARLISAGGLARASSRRRRRAGWRRARAWRSSSRMFSRNLSGISCAVASCSAFTEPGGGGELRERAQGVVHLRRDPHGRDSLRSRRCFGEPGGADRGDVAVVGAAAAAEDVQLRQARLAARRSARARSAGSPSSSSVASSSSAWLFAEAFARRPPIRCEPRLAARRARPRNASGGRS